MKPGKITHNLEESPEKSGENNIPVREKKDLSVFVKFVWNFPGECDILYS